MAKKTALAPPPPPANPRWPAVALKGNLVCTELEPDQVITIDGFLSSAECRAFAAVINAQKLTVTPPAKKGEADRVNDRISFTDPSFASSFYNAIQPYVSHIPSFKTSINAAPCGLNDNIRLYRYSPGQYFGAHYDDSITHPKTGAWSEWTLLVYVSGAEDGVQGGETVFYKPGPKRGQMTEIIAPLKRGSALLHRHGRECMLHEGKQVEAGTKLVLRSDLMFSRVSS